MSAYRFVQSEYFGGIIASEINKTISNKLMLDMSFSNIEIEMFPPSTRLKNVSISSRRKDSEFDITAGSLVLAFGLSDFFGSKFSIQEVGLVDADIDLTRIVLNNSEEELSPQKYFPLIRALFKENLPVKIGGINLERSNINSNYINGFFKKLDVDVYKSVIEANISGYAVSLDKKLLKNDNLNDLDYLSVEFHLNEKKLLLKKSELWKKSQNIIVEGALLFDKEMSFKGEGYFRGILENLDFLHSHETYKDLDPKGVIEVRSAIETNLSNEFKFDGSIRAVNLKTKYAILDGLYSEFEIDDKEVVINEFLAEDRNGSVELEDEVRLYDFVTKQIVSNEVLFKFDNFHTNSLLYFLEDSLNSIKGKLNGGVAVKWQDEKIHFNVVNKSFLDQFRLNSNSITPILENDRVTIHKGLIEVDMSGAVDMVFDIGVGNVSRFRGRGFVEGEKVDFKVSKSNVDFSEVGPISGLPLYGEGDFQMTIKGAGEDVNFDFGLDMSKVKILDFNITKLKGNLGLSLADLLLSVKGVTGDFLNTSYSSNGFIDFNKNKINLAIDVRKSELEDAIYILEPISKNLEFLKSKYLSLSFKSKIKLSGGLSDNELRVYGILDGRDLSMYKEKSESLSFNFDFVDNVLSLNEVKLRQSSSEFLGQFKINTKSNYFEYDAKLLSGQLEDFEIYRALNLGYSSEVNGEFYGKGTLDDFSTRSHLRFTNSFLGNVQVPESLVTVYNNSKEVFSSGNFLGDRSSYNLYLNFDEKNAQKSYVNAFMNFKNIKELVGVISNHNMDSEEVSGSIKGSLKSSFSVFNLEKLSLDLALDELMFNKASETLRINGDRARFSLVDGAVEDINFHIVSNQNNFFTLSGGGNLSDGINIKQEFELNSSFLELLSSKVSKSSGKIIGEGRISGDANSLVFEHSFRGKEIFLNVLGVPSSFSNVSFDIVFEQNSLMVNKLVGQFGKGDVEARGLVRFVLPYPEVDLSVSFLNSYIPLFKKSGVLASGRAKIEGKEFPYLLNGSVTILNGTIVDELQDLAPSGVSGGSVTTKYVPENKFDNKFDLFELDLSVNFDKPIIVRNLLTDLRLLGNGRISGKLYKPVVNGVIEVVPGLSKLLFKGNEFVLKEGSIVFTDDKGLVPELNFISSSAVNQYTVNLDVYGLANNPQLNISSDPFLNQEDIFSLLTLGFTSEVSDQLEEKERRSATTLGIGTLLFDQLLKNQGLSSNLGLKLSVLPEFEENESSLLKGKSGVSDSRSGRYKSATKIKLEKKISRNVDLSLASTVGGSAEQKQEMNVNYNILKNVSLEGVYEINSTNEEQSKEPKSFGVDVKIQWTY